MPTHLYGKDPQWQQETEIELTPAQAKCKFTDSVKERIDSGKEDSRSNERIQAQTPTLQCECAVSISQKKGTVVLGIQNQRCLSLHSITSHK